MTNPILIESAILETLAYSDIFDYPLRLDEVHRYLPLRATQEDVQIALSRTAKVDCRNQLYFLKGNDHKVNIRLSRTGASLRTLKLAAFYGQILGWVPFVRMVAITGSLAALNLDDDEGADMDYMLVTQPNRLWIARAFAVTFGRLMRPFGKMICVNLLVTTDALTWPSHELYSAREISQMIPVVGMETYRRLRSANPWAESILPNSFIEPENTKIIVKDRVSIIQKLGEILFNSDRLERWAMKFQLQKIARRGDSDESHFSMDVCQGNFHNHRKWTLENYRSRLLALGIESRIDESV